MDIQSVISNFKHNGYAVSYFENSTEAAFYLNRVIDDKHVGFGDSQTLYDLGLYEKLSGHNRVVDPQHCAEGKSFKETAKECLTADIFITSVNGASESGELINIDGLGNRVAGSLFGHEKVYFVIGINKFAPTFDKAYWRARNVAGPRNAQRYNLQTPCAKLADRCYDCSSPDRICNGVIVHYKKMKGMDMEVVIIGEEMGF